LAVIETPNLVQGAQVVCDGGPRDDKLELAESMLRPAWGSDRHFARTSEAIFTLYTRSSATSALLNLTKYVATTVFTDYFVSFPPQPSPPISQCLLR